MNNQTGPYREGETIDDDDIKRITGMLYGGEILYSDPGFSSDTDRTRNIAATDTVGISMLVH